MHLRRRRNRWHLTPSGLSLIVWWTRLTVAVSPFMFLPVIVSQQHYRLVCLENGTESNIPSVLGQYRPRTQPSVVRNPGEAVWSREWQALPLQQHRLSNFLNGFRLQSFAFVDSLLVEFVLQSQSLEAFRRPLPTTRLQVRRIRPKCLLVRLPPGPPIPVLGRHPWSNAWHVPPTLLLEVSWSMLSIRHGLATTLLLPLLIERTYIRITYWNIKHLVEHLCEVELVGA